MNLLIKIVSFCVVIFTSFSPALSMAENIACPDRIQYKGGTYLKKGTDYYFPNGTYLLRADAIYYPNGSYLSRSGNTYYPNGSYLSKGANLYFPNGSYLKKDANYYYANGTYLKKDANLYYSNGTYARHNGKLYRPDGSITPFPITLNEKIETYGSLEAEVFETSERMEVFFRDLIVNTNGVSLQAIWNGTSFSSYEVQIRTGIPNENVLVLIQNGQASCYLDGGPATPPSTFSVYGRAGRATVTVNPGYLPQTVRDAIQRALDF